MIIRERKSKFVRLFDKTPPQVRCPHFYELILSNGCPYDCNYCYLKLTFRGNTRPNLFNNPWDKAKRELEKIPKGLFSTGELSDSLAIIPPLLSPALDYFESQKDKCLLLLTKSVNIGILKARQPSRNIIVSFSLNAPLASQKHENGAPSPIKRLLAAKELNSLGWRIRIRLDPIIGEIGLESYKEICQRIADLEPEMVTIGSLRQYPGLFNYAKAAPRKGLERAKDGRMRYPLNQRVEMYEQVKEWLNFQPSLCKETNEVWKRLDWIFKGCNCTPYPNGN